MPSYFKPSNIVVLDKSGSPVKFDKGRWLTNLFRLARHGRRLARLEKWCAVRCVSVDEGEKMIALGWHFGGYGIGDTMTVFREHEQIVSLFGAELLVIN